MSERDPKDWKHAGEIALTIGLRRAGELMQDSLDPKGLEVLLKTVADVVGTGLILSPDKKEAKPNAPQEEDTEDDTDD